MDTAALAEMVGLPRKAVKFLLEGKIVTLPLQEEDLYFLQKYAETWGKRELVRLQIAPLAQKERASMLFGADLTKIERRIVSRLLAHYAKGDGTYLHLSQVVDEVMTYFSLPPEIRNKIMVIARKMRKKVCNLRYRNESVDDIAQRLNGPKKIQNRTRRQQEGRQSSSLQAMHNLLGL